MCEGCEGCEGCACEGCECNNGLFYACLCCCYTVEPVAEVHSDVKQEKKKEQTQIPPLVMLRSGQDGYQTV